jgi:hypothetical protein
MQTMMNAPVSTLFDEITDFLASSPTSAQIVAYRPSTPLDDRLHELLDKQSEDELSQSEAAELDEFIQMNHFLTVLKAKTRLNLVSAT